MQRVENITVNSLAMLSPFFLPKEVLGHKFDVAMQLLELDALREPEATQYPKIGDYLRSRGIILHEIPKPQIVAREPMPFRGLRYYPDYFIANDTKMWLHSHTAPHTYLHPSHKHEWGNDVTYDVVSLINHPRGMHDALETWCQKLCGFGLNKIVAKYHRAVWLPLYYSESLGTIWPTKFHYPQEGYFGKIAEVLGTIEPSKANVSVRPVETIGIGTCYALAKSINRISVLFVLDEQTPIYRITNQTVCAGRPNEIHQLVVEFREQPTNLERDLAAYGYELKECTFGSGRIVPPTRANVEAGYNFGNNLNAQIWKGMNESASHA